MSVVANTYRLIGEMGSGGGGVVYLGEHLRLSKKVVLKADKRSLSAKPEALRREVDALKDLSHTYIPQVYDFVVENETVYTVMDFIDGESFDKPLKRGERFSQAQVIEWACQLLEALEYLHSRPPHGILHADIKPANVMITPEGDIRLIDFNIALALGEEGAVAVGRSFGYASPEHYRSIESSSNIHTATTVLELTGRTPSSGSSNGTPGKKSIMLDVRSDIYSLGATLYHILSGERPSGDVTAIKPLSLKEFSPAVINIIAKAMASDPDKRWQSVTEMLHAFRHLRENDPRTIRHKRRVFTTIAACLALFLIGGITAFAGYRQIEQSHAAEAMAAALLEQQRLEQEAEEMVELHRLEQEQTALEMAELQRIEQQQTALLMSERSGIALHEGDVTSAIAYALAAILQEKGDYDVISPLPEAQLALTNALGIYDISDSFRSHGIITLPSAPFFMTISPDGNTAAFVHASGISIYNTYTMQNIALLPGGTSALAQAAFLNNATLIYAGQGIRAFNFVTGQELWVGGAATAISLSADGLVAAVIYRDESSARVYCTVSGNLLHLVDFNGKRQRVVVNDVFANPNDNLLAINSDGTWLGVSFACGSLWLYDLTNEREHINIFDETSGFTRFAGGFYDNFFAFSATGRENSIFSVICTKETEQTGGFSSATPFNAQANSNGVFVQTGNILVSLHPYTGEQTALVNTTENIMSFAIGVNHTVISTRDNFMFFDTNANLLSTHENIQQGVFTQIAGQFALVGSRDTPAVRVLRLENHTSANVFTFDPLYRLSEARINAERTTIMFFSFNRFRLYDITSGCLIAETNIPDETEVFDQLFQRNEMGSYLEVIYNDGRRRHYSAADGTLLSEHMGEQPDLTFFEQFYTDTLRIDSPLHDTPRAYCVTTGEFVTELERDAFLTYVTQAGKHIVTQYITTDGYIFGILLNAAGEAIAYMPHLADVKGESLFFMYPTGNVRETRIYFIDEIIELARKKN